MVSLTNIYWIIGHRCVSASSWQDVSTEWAKKKLIQNLCINKYYILMYMCALGEWVQTGFWMPDIGSVCKWPGHSAIHLAQSLLRAAIIQAWCLFMRCTQPGQVARRQLSLPGLYLLPSSRSQPAPARQQRGGRERERQRHLIVSLISTPDSESCLQVLFSFSYHTFFEIDYS